MIILGILISHGLITMFLGDPNYIAIRLLMSFLLDVNHNLGDDY